MKIEALIEIADSQIPLNEKVEKVNSNRLDLSILFLLLEQDDVFNRTFPVKEVVQDLDLLKSYFHARINKKIFKSLTGVADFTIKCLEDGELFNTFNELSSGQLIKELTDSLQGGELLNKVLDKGLLPVYLERSIFDNGFITAKHIGKENLELIKKFVEDNSTYFTPEYFSGLESLPEEYYKLVEPQLIKHYDGNLKGLYKNFESNIDLKDSDFIEQLSDRQIIELSQSPELLQFFYKEDKYHTGFHSFEEITERLINMGPEAVLSDTVNEKLLYHLLVNSELDFARGIVKKYSAKTVKELWEQDSYPDTLKKVLDEMTILSGDFSSIQELENLNDFEIPNENLIEIVFNKITKDKNFWLHNLSGLNKYEEIKTELGNRLLKEESFKKDNLSELDLDISWYVEKMGIEWTLKNLDGYSSRSEKLLQDLGSTHPKETGAYFLKKISHKDTGKYEANKIVDSLIEHNLVTPQQIANLMAKNKIEITPELLNFLTPELFEKLLEKSDLEKSDLLCSPHMSEKTRSSVISKMKGIDFYGHNAKPWLAAPLTESQIQKIWDKVKDEDNKHIKNLMFGLMKHHADTMSAELKKEIFSRAKKLKGYEETVGIDEADEKALDRSFTKAIATPKGAFDALSDSDFESLLTQKNLLRIANKLSGESEANAWLESPYLNPLIDTEILDVLLREDKWGRATIRVFFLKHLSKTNLLKYAAKINQEKNSIHLDRTENKMELIPEVLNAVLMRLPSPLSFLRQCSEETINNLIKSDQWTKIFLIKDDDYSRLFSEEEIISIIRSMPVQRRAAFLKSKYLNNGSRDAAKLTENITDLLMEFVPTDLQALLKSEGDSMPPNIFKRLILAYPEADFDLNEVIDRKDIFTRDELAKIFKNTTKSQFANATRYSGLNVNNLNDEELDLLMCEENLNKIPASYWEARHLVSVDPLTPEFLQSFFTKNNSEADHVSPFAKVAMLSKEDKAELVRKLQRTSMNIHVFESVWHMRDLLGVDAAVLEQLVLKLDKESYAHILFKFPSYVFEFSVMTVPTKLELLKKLIGDVTDLDVVAPLLVLLPPQHPYRLQIISNAKESSTLRRALILPDLTEQELAKISELIVSLDNKHFRLNSTMPPEYWSFLLNDLVSKKYFMYNEINKQIEVTICGTLVATLGKQPEFMPALSPSSQAMITKYFVVLSAELPEKIAGTYSLKESKFEPSESVSPELKELLDNALQGENFGLSDEGIETVKAVLRFGAATNMKAVAVRRLNNQDLEAYTIELIVDESLLKKRTEFVSSDFLNVLKSQETDLKSFLDKALTPNHNRTFGFELEFSANRSMKEVATQMKQVTKKAVVVKNSYGSSDGKSWDLKVDGSVQAVNGFSMELASPILSGSDGVEQSRKVLNKIFSDFDIKTGEATNGGLHVHHDIKDLLEIAKEKKDIVTHFYAFQESLYAICDLWRQKNTFCSRIELGEIDGESEISRHVGFNVSPYGTMEFRMRESLQDVESILRWIVLTQKVVDSASLSMSKQTKEFRESAKLTLEAISHEKALQLKNMREDEMASQIDRFMQARLHAEMVLQK